MLCDSIVRQKTVLFLSYVLEFGRFCEENSNNCHGDTSVQDLLLSDFHVRFRDRFG